MLQFAGTSLVVSEMEGVCVYNLFSRKTQFLSVRAPEFWFKNPFTSCVFLNLFLFIFLVFHNFFIATRHNIALTIRQATNNAICVALLLKLIRV